ncbi:MAG TPA: 2-amino-4-hydroxy-6-hydroxymethyldihydropteridine diphosphokinase [Thermoanaerobaculia bacterium]|nr:2-amino-4-hydroxy-6-hydroxymethyldihydropteridine diphosphokinase [Thermoanaerobaculia bacterium]
MTKKRISTTTRNDSFVALALGGNLGPVEEHFDRALGVLGAHLSEIRMAPIYRTPAISPIPQPDYLNSALVARSPLDAESLLALCQAIERSVGRSRGERWGPRPLDLDLLWFGERISTRPEITLPHPRLAERRFVLQPLADLIPDVRVPLKGQTVRELLARLPPEVLERV